MDDNRKKALAAALGQIEKQFGKGSVMRLGDASAAMDFDVIPTGSLCLDIALGVGGLPRGRVVEKGTNVPVRIRAHEVNGGDYVVVDRSAAIFIAPENIERVLEAAEMIVAKEAAMAKAILSGTPIGEVMGGNYEHMLENH